MRMARCRAIGDDRHRKARSVRRVVQDLDVEHGRQPTQALRANTKRIDLVVDLQPQLLEAGQRRAPSGARPEHWHVAPLPTRASLASSIAFSAAPPMPIPSTPGGHQPAPIAGTVFSTQSTIESDGLSMMNLDLFSDPPPLAAMSTSTVLPGTSS